MLSTLISDEFDRYSLAGFFGNKELMGLISYISGWVVVVFTILLSMQMVVLAWAERFPNDMGKLECISCLLMMLSADFHIACSMLVRVRGYPILELVVFPILLIFVDAFKRLEELFRTKRGDLSMP